MLRLNNSDLPSTPQRYPVSAPLLRIKTIAPPNIRPPFARINTLSDFGLRPGFEPTDEPLPSPLYVGGHFQIPFSQSTENNYPVTSAIALSINGISYTSITDVNQVGNIVPGSAWFDETTLNLYASSRFPAAADNTIRANIVVQAQVPIPDANINYDLDISDFIGTNGFAVTRLVSGGLEFLPIQNVNDPQTGEFRQTGGDIRFYGELGYKPRTLTNLQIEGVWQGTLSASLAVLATYDLEPLEVEYLDSISHLGVEFRRSRTPYTPTAGGMLASRRLATLFIPTEKGQWLSAEPVESRFTSGLGEVNYQTGIVG